MKGGMAVLAINVPLISPAISPTHTPANTGKMNGKSVKFGYSARVFGCCANDAVTIAAAATSEPEDKSTPPVMIH